MHMDKHYIESHDVLRRYHMKQLSEDELGSFEIYLIENPDYLVEVEADYVLRESYRLHQDLLVTKPHTSSRGWLAGGAVAACLFVAVLTVIPGRKPVEEFTLQDPVTLESFRGVGEQAVRIQGDPVVQLRFDVGPPELLAENAFTAELSGPSGTAVFSISGLRADGDGWIYYPLTGQQESLAGSYEVRLYPDGQPGAARTWHVEFVDP